MKTKLKNQHVDTSNIIKISDWCRYTLDLNFHPKQVLILDETYKPGNIHSILCLGRRSGKTFVAACIAAYGGIVMAPYLKQYLGAKTTFTIYFVANSLAQAREILVALKDIIYNAPPRILKNGKVFKLSNMVKKVNGKNLDNENTLVLKNGCIFKAIPANSSTSRGKSTPIVFFDEVAHGHNTDSKISADELYKALQPGLAQFGMLGRFIMLSSPFDESGLFHEFYKQGAKWNDDKQSFIFDDDTRHDVKVFQFPTWKVNYRINLGFLRTIKKADPELFDVEYGANFGKKISDFLHKSAITASVNNEFVQDNSNYLDAEVVPRYRYNYSLGLDPAKGGLGRDSYVACLCHYEINPKLLENMYKKDELKELEQNNRYLKNKHENISIKQKKDTETEELFRPIMVIDFFYEFETNFNGMVSTEEVILFILELNKIYGLDKVCMDSYNCMAIIEALIDHLDVEEIIWNLKTKTIAYNKVKELFYSDRMIMPKHDLAIKQFKNLKRELKDNGLMNVTGGDGNAVDDYPDAAAIAILNASEPFVGSLL